ncbi:MAG: hypothetical protein EOP85_03585 [Verrucomicrobiaceae bacterium]|nr:MAG: hypothetical protein EOP85_03585 [Verrucomicrobiaceae bacterium]
MEESSREHEVPQAGRPQPPPLPQPREMSALHAPQVRLTLGSAGPDTAPAAPALPHAPAPSPSSVRQDAVKAERSVKRMRLVEAACWTFLVLGLAGSLLGNALLSAGWKADVAVKEKRWREIDRKRQAARSTHTQNRTLLESSRHTVIDSFFLLVDKEAELTDQKKLETEIKTSIVVMEQQLMHAGLMPHAPIPEKWPSEELDAILASSPSSRSPHADQVR